MASSHESLRPPETHGHHSPEMGPELDLSAIPIACVGGLGTVKQAAEWYDPISSKDTESPLPPNKRFLAPPKQGLGNIEEMHEETNERLTTMHERLDGRKMLLVGHSLGALLVTKVAVERPDLVAGVVALGGVHEGYRQDTPGTHLLKLFLGRHPQAGHLRHDSDYMLEHKEDMNTKWPEDVPLYIISTPLDQLIVPPQGFGVTPGKSEVHKRLVIPPILGLETVLRKTMGIEDDVEMMRSLYPTEHLNLPRNPDIANYIQVARHAIAGLPAEEPAKQASRLPSVSFRKPKLPLAA